MNQLKYGTISHQGLPYNNPFSVEKIEAVIDLLGLNDQAVVLDIGSGKAELLIRLVERYQVNALGLELDSSSVQEALSQAASRIPPGKLELRACDAQTFESEPDAFDLASCLGSCHIYGGFRPTLERLAHSVRPGGYVLLGDGYWKKEPSPEYLAALETTRDELQMHAENVATGVSLDLIPMYACVCNEDEWDRFEWLRMYERALSSIPTAEAQSFTARLDELLWYSSCLVAGIWSSLWLYQEQMCFLFRERLMFDTTWDNKQFSWTQNHVAITQTYGQAPLEDQKEVVGIIMFVPDKFALNFHDHNIVCI